MGNCLSYGLGARGHWFDMVGGVEGEVNVSAGIGIEPQKNESRVATKNKALRGSVLSVLSEPLPTARCFP